MSNSENQTKEEWHEHCRNMTAAMELLVRSAIGVWGDPEYAFYILREQIKGAREEFYCNYPALYPLKYKKIRMSRALRTEVFERDAYRCVKCGSYKTLSVDHKIPESLGGTLRLDNLQTLCMSCNARKGIKTDEQCGIDSHSELREVPTLP